MSEAYPKDFVKSLAKGLEVIGSFNAEHPHQTLSDVARNTGMTRASARRFLRTLTTLGYVEQDGARFSLRPTVLKIGRAYLSMLTLLQKRLQGAIFGGTSPRTQIPHLLNMYRSGQLKLDELITKTYSLDEINQGYQDMRDGKNIRGVIVYTDADY